MLSCTVLNALFGYQTLVIQETNPKRF